jgi:hypothetical protein
MFTAPRSTPIRPAVKLLAIWALLSSPSAAPFRRGWTVCAVAIRSPMSPRSNTSSGRQRSYRLGDRYASNRPKALSSKRASGSNSYPRIHVKPTLFILNQELHGNDAHLATESCNAYDDELIEIERTGCPITRNPVRNPSYRCQNACTVPLYPTTQ